MGFFSLCCSKVEQPSKKLSWGVRGQGLPTFLAFGHAYPNIPLAQSHIMHPVSVKSCGDEGVPGIAGRWEVTVAAPRSRSSVV